MKTYIVDIDGTVANNEHRIHYLTNGHKDWKNWHAASQKDSVIEEVAEIVRMAYDNKICIVFCTGRMEFCRADTEAWLQENKIPYDKLYMRPDKDHRDDDIVKFELLQQIRDDGFEPVLVLEDRARVVKMWRAQGLRTLAVADGDF